MRFQDLFNLVAVCYIGAVAPRAIIESGALDPLGKLIPKDPVEERIRQKFENDLVSGQQDKVAHYQEVMKNAEESHLKIKKTHETTAKWSL